MAGSHFPWPAGRGDRRRGLAVLRIGKKALKSPALWCIAAASFVAIYFFHVSFVLIIAAAALLG